MSIRISFGAASVPITCCDGFAIDTTASAITHIELITRVMDSRASAMDLWLLGSARGFDMVRSLSKTVLELEYKSRVHVSGHRSGVPPMGRLIEEMDTQDMDNEPAVGAGEHEMDTQDMDNEHASEPAVGAGEQAEQSEPTMPTEVGEVIEDVEVIEDSMEELKQHEAWLKELTEAQQGCDEEGEEDGNGKEGDEAKGEDEAEGFPQTAEIFELSEAGLPIRRRPCPY